MKENKGLKVFVAGKYYSNEFLGLQDDDEVRIGRSLKGEPRLQKLNKITDEWENVDHPENYGWPSISIIRDL